MVAIPKKIKDRYSKAVPKFQRILKTSRDHDQNEADTVTIVKDILAEVFGYDKYSEITGEYAIRGTFCDLAITIDEKIQHLIEVKAVGITLKEGHLRQAVDYGANKGIQWVVLTNGIIWELHRIKFEKPIDHELVISFDFLTLNPRKTEDQEKLFLLSKKAIGKRAREEYYKRTQNVNRFVIGAVVLSDHIMREIRKDVRRLSPGLIVDLPEIDEILKNEVLKRDVIEGDEAVRASRDVRKLIKPTTKSKKETSKGSENSKMVVLDTDKKPGSPPKAKELAP